MPLSRSDLAALQKLQRVICGPEKPDVKLPYLMHDDGRPVLVKWRVYTKVMAQAMRELEINGWEAATHVVGPGLLGEDYTDDLAPYVRMIVEDEVNKRGAAITV